MRIAVHSRIVVSKRHIHPTPETVERAFERLQHSENVPASQAKTTSTGYQSPVEQL